MALNRHPRVAILWRGDAEARKNATAENSRLRLVFDAFERSQISAEPVVYHETALDEVRQQLHGVDGVLV